MPMNKARRGGNRRPQNKQGSGALYAAVDLGTNNCRLLIAERRGDYFKVVDSHSQIARLGEGLAETGRLSDASIDRAIDALKAIRVKTKRRGVGHIRCIATEACRQAENGKEFVARVQAETGFSFKIIGGREEARLAAIGCHDLIDPDVGRIMVLDIGGGSTEISFVDPTGLDPSNLPTLVRKVPILNWRSFPVGVVTLHDRFEHLKGTEDEGFAEMVAYVRDIFSGWKGGRSHVDHMSNGKSHIIGTSGTVTCLAGVHLNLKQYRRDRVDGSWMSWDDGEAVIEKMVSAGVDGRSAFPTIGEERAALMVQGCAILRAAWDVWPAASMRVADRGLREGLLLSMIHAPKKSRRRRGRGKSKAPTSSEAAA